MLDQGKPHRRKRFAFRFGLGTLFVFVTIICCGLGWARKTSEDRRAAIQQIEELGGSVSFEQPASKGRWTIPEWLKRAFGDELFVTVERISLLGPRFDDESIACIRHLREAKWLSSYSSGVTDAGMRWVGRLRQLEELYLSNLDVSDVGIEHLANLKHLKRLQINACSLEVTDRSRDLLVATLPQFQADSDVPVRSGSLFLGN